MKNLEIKTRNTRNNEPKYTQNLKSVTVFLNHPEDRITIIKGEESVNIEIYQNGNNIFLGDKYELFEKSATTEEITKIAGWKNETDKSTTEKEKLTTAEELKKRWTDSKTFTTTENLTVEQAKEFLASQGYYTGNLWRVDDVKSNYDCTDEQAQNILDSALQNDATKEQIWFAIHMEADELKLTKIVNEEEA